MTRKIFENYRLLAIGALIIVLALYRTGPRAVKAQNGQGTTPVTVTNTVASPVLVRDVDNPVDEALQTQLCAVTGTSTCPGGTISSFTVPTTVGSHTVHRLVIEYVNSFCLINSGTGSVAAAVLGTTVDGRLIDWFFPTPQLSDSSFRSNQLTRIYADPGTTLNPSINVAGSPNTTCFVSISGYLVFE
jgi:hypothetical protein